ncbi:MAG: hypothetical protein FJW40_23750 [Acidobacteria bacterium]|nr:hypothetical protein [Acidobacteriota bacterium]
MAGIGFVLRKLVNRDDLLGVMTGYGHSAVAAAGPWLITIIALVSISQFSAGRVEPEDLASFRLITIYNFGFSLVLGSAITQVATRYLSDRIYCRDIRPAPGMLLAALALNGAAQLPLAAGFYFLVLNATAAVKAAAVVNYFVISMLWLVAIFLTALKAHRVITTAFAIGMTVACWASVTPAPWYGTAGMLMGFSGGVALIFFPLAARVFAEYRHRVERSWDFLPYFKRYWTLAASAFFYNTAIWVDKWILWLAPEREKLPIGLVSYPDYDSAMFLAYLSIIPSLSLFVLNIETRFFEDYRRFYGEIQRHATLAKVRVNHERLVECILESGRNFLVLQAACSAAAILFAPQLFDLMKVNAIQYGMFRLGVLGAAFHAMFLFLGILLSYFELNKLALRLNVLFLVTNALFSYLSLQGGLAWYGYGYLAACVTTFAVGFLVVARELNRLPYVAFIGANSSVRT